MPAIAPQMTDKRCTITAALSLGLLSWGRTSHWPLKLDRLWFLDAVSLAVFTILGTQVALTTTQSPVGICALMGMLTAVGGGLLRDALGAEKPFIFREPGYASTSFLGGLAYAILSVKLGLEFAEFMAILAVLLIRYLVRTGTRTTVSFSQTRCKGASIKCCSSKRA